MKAIPSLGLGDLTRAASKEPGRYSYEHILYDAEKGRLVATNGSIMAICHVIPEPGEVTGYITREAFLEWRRLATKDKTFGPWNQHIVFRALAGTIELSDPIGGTWRTWQRPQMPKAGFPNYEAVLPKVEGEPAFTLDFELLKSIFDAIGQPQDGYTKSSDGYTKSSLVAIWPNPDKNCPSLIKTAISGGLGIIAPRRCTSENWLLTLDAIEEAHKPKKEPKPRKAKAKAVAAGADKVVSMPAPAAESEAQVGEQTGTADTAPAA